MYDYFHRHHRNFYNNYSHSLRDASPCRDAKSWFLEPFEYDLRQWIIYEQNSPPSLKSCWRAWQLIKLISWHNEQSPQKPEKGAVCHCWTRPIYCSIMKTVLKASPRFESLIVNAHAIVLTDSSTGRPLWYARKKKAKCKSTERKWIIPPTEKKCIQMKPARREHFPWPIP